MVEQPKRFRPELLVLMYVGADRMVALELVEPGLPAKAVAEWASPNVESGVTLRVDDEELASALRLRLQERAAVFVAEAVLTAIFLAVILSVTAKAEYQAFAPIGIGLTLTLIHLISIPISNTSVNPARSIATAVYGGALPLSQLWVLILAPIAGALVAGDDRQQHLERAGNDIGVAHTGADDAHQHLPRTGIGQVDLLELVLAVGGAQHCCGDLHLWDLCALSSIGGG